MSNLLPLAVPALDRPIRGNAAAQATEQLPTVDDAGLEETIAGAALRAIGIKKNYHLGSTPIPVLRDVNLDVSAGEFLAVVGQSGSGKSTLLHVLGTLDQPDAGEVWFDNQRIDNLAPRLRDEFRNQRLGMIFQFYHLLPELTMLENVLMPLMIAHGVMQYYLHRRRHVAEAKRFIDLVGLSHRMKHKPRQLSGGEMQRAAIARALVNHPQVLLADEPTGNLDTQTGGEILELLRSLNRRQKLTIVMVTHDPAIAAGADRSLRLIDGRLETTNAMTNV